MFSKVNLQDISRDNMFVAQAPDFNRLPFPWGACLTEQLLPTVEKLAAQASGPHEMPLLQGPSAPWNVFWDPQKPHCWCFFPDLQKPFGSDWFESWFHSTSSRTKMAPKLGNDCVCVCIYMFACVYPACECVCVLFSYHCRCSFISYLDKSQYLNMCKIPCEITSSWGPDYCHGNAFACEIRFGTTRLGTVFCVD